VCRVRRVHFSCIYRSARVQQSASSVKVVELESPGGDVAATLCSFGTCGPGEERV